MAEDVDALLAEFAGRYVRGEDPDVGEYLGRAGPAADDLAAAIDALVARLPVPEPDPESVAIMSAWIRGESPLSELRSLRGIRRDALTASLVEHLGLAAERTAKVGRYMHRLEAGLLEPRRVSARVWDALAAALGPRVRDAAALRPQLPSAAAAYRAKPGEEPLVPLPVPEEAGEWDEVDELFLGRREP
jgi:hypothetical protein